MLTKLQDWLDKKIDKSDEKYVFNRVGEHSAELLHDAIQLKKELLQHRDNGDVVAIVADYDSDGMNSAAILTVLMRVLEMEFKVYIPDRVIDGYGLSKRLVDLSVTDGCDFILTCDNGIAANESIAYAKSLDIPVYITDHHERKEELPIADLIVHPALGDYPWAGLSGGAVVYKLCQLFYDEPNFTEERIKTIEAYAAISIITDVMDLSPTEFNENREIVMKGIDAIRYYPLKSLDVLLATLGQTKEYVTETTIGFFIGPSLNASGRIGAPYLSYALLVEEDEYKARLIAREMKYVNELRKTITKDLQKEVNETLTTTDPIHVVYRDGIHEGVIGLIAGNISTNQNAPSIVFTNTSDNENGEEQLKASCRSNTISMYKLLETINQDYFVGWGGHPQAAGVTIYKKYLEDFKREAMEITAEMLKDYEAPVEDVMDVDIMDLQDYFEDLEVLRPMGQGFRQPEASCMLNVLNVIVYNKSGHVKLMLEDKKELWLFKSAYDDEMKELIANSKEINSNKSRLIKEGHPMDYAIKNQAVTYAHPNCTFDHPVYMNIKVKYNFENGLSFLNQTYSSISSIISYEYEPSVYTKESVTTEVESTGDLFARLFT